MEMDDYFFLGHLDSSFPLPPDEPFTLAMALSAGVARHQLRRLEVDRVVRRALAGVYVSSHLPDTVALRARCLRLVVPADSVVVDRHAGWLLGAQMVLAPNEHLALQTPVDLPTIRTRPAAQQAVGQRREESRRRRRHRGRRRPRSTTPVRTAWDLGRVRWMDEAITGLDAMLRLDAFTREELIQGIRRFRGMRWVTTLRAMAPLADAAQRVPRRVRAAAALHRGPAAGDDSAGRGPPPRPTLGAARPGQRGGARRRRVRRRRMALGPGPATARS